MDPKLILQIVQLVFSVAYQINQANKLKREADKRKGFRINKRGESAHVPIVYGKQAVGLIEANHIVKDSYVYASPGTNGTEFNSKKNALTASASGKKNEYLIMNGAICHEGIEEVISVEIDEQIYNYDKDHRHTIHTYNDDLTSTAPLGTANGIGSDHKFTNFASATAAFKLNRDEYNYNGIPNITFFVKGRKVRTIDSNNNLSTTYTYSNNPAYVLLDYLMLEKGRNLDSSDIDLASFRAAALICDEIKIQNRTYAGAVNGQKALEAYNTFSEFPATDTDEPNENVIYLAEDTTTYYNFTSTGTSQNPSGNYTTTSLPTRDISLYECNIVLDTEAKIRDNIEAILSTMPLAVLTWSSEGKYKLLLEYPETQSELDLLAVETFNDSNVIRDSIELQWLSASERYNQVSCTFLNEHENFKEDSVTWPSDNSTVYATYLSEDNNQPMSTSMNLEGITDPYHALARAEQVVRQSRTYHSLNFTSDKNALRIEPGDFIKVELDTSDINAMYRVESIEVNEDLTAKLYCHFVDVYSFAWNVSDNVAYPVDIGGVNFSVDPPSNLTFTARGSAGFNPDILSLAQGVLSWTASTDSSVVQYYVEASNNAGSDFFRLGITDGTSFDVQGLQTGNYIFGVRGVTRTGFITGRNITSSTLSIDAINPVTAKITPVDDKFYLEYGTTWDGTKLDFDFTFTDLEGNDVARRRYRVNRSNETWQTAVEIRDQDTTNELNTSRLVATLAVDGTSANLTVDYSHDGVTGQGIVQAFLITQGQTGADGGVSTNISLFKRSTSQPSVPSNSDWEYNFSTNTLSVQSGGSQNNWYTSIPIGTLPVWQTSATAASATATGTDSNITWGTAVKAFEDGATIYRGNLYYKYMYDQAPSFSSSGIGFNTTSETLTNLPTDWQEAIPELDVPDSSHPNTNLSTGDPYPGDYLQWSVTYQVKVPADGTPVLTFSSSVIGAQLFETRIQSDNYQTGSLGWMIDRNTGAAEFGSAVIRDTLTVGDNVNYPTNGIPQSQISDLQTTLGTKNAVYYQTTFPTGSTSEPLATNDLWYDTDDNNKLYRYTGSGTTTSSASDWTVVSIQADSVVADWIGTQELAANQINAASLSAIQANTGSLTIDNVLRLSGGAGLIANRTSSSDYSTQGFYIGQAGTNDFEFSHMSTNNSNQLSGLINSSDGTGLQIFNPTFYSGGSSSGGQTAMTTSGSYTVGDVDSFTLTVVGGGGAGGYGLDDGYLTNSYAASGGTSTATVYRGGSYVGQWSASGGSGGQNAYSSVRTGGNGTSSPYGTGGTGGLKNNPGGNGGLGAGGGGGGGDDSSFFDSSGGSGSGGGAGQTNSVTVDCSAYSGSVTVSFSRGNGGSGGGGTYGGGSGGNGVGYFSSPLGGTTEVTLAEMLESTTVGKNTGAYTASMGNNLSVSLPHSSSNTSVTDRWIVGFMHDRDGNSATLTFPTSNVTGGYTLSSNYTVTTAPGHFWQQTAWRKWSNSSSLTTSNTVLLSNENFWWWGVIHTSGTTTWTRNTTAHNQVWFISA